ncbi:MAG TPA: conjugal transfer protein TraD [Azospirillaceae bacterium]|nr:conjugal transfer protein TraD [Azospirillaceae bacterium]
MTTSLAERQARLARSRARVAEQEARLREAERKAHTRLLIELGTLVDRAGLATLPADTLLGAFLSLTARAADAGELEAWTSAGVQARRRDEDGRVPVVATFRTEPAPDQGAQLRAAGLRRNRVLGHWEGVVDAGAAAALVARCGGTLRQVDPPRTPMDPAETGAV